jgi:Mn-dependent DtxR family transcriptional regulator
MNSMNNTVRESGEDYLEAIFVIRNRKGYVRAVDIAAELSYSKPSVSRAVGILAKKNLLTIQNDGSIILTEEGLSKASAIFDRHSVIKGFFIDNLGVEPETAEADACKVEHALSEETYGKLKEFIENL